MIYASAHQNWHDIFFTSQDGLRLYGRYYRAAPSGRRPAVCLAGLTRNSRDFHVLASYLSDPHNPQARDVVTLDYRGRGRSASDPNWRNYSILVEMQDALDLLTIVGISEAAVIGSSRGGLTAMIMACLRPTAIGAVVLNDIGPIIEREGLLRIAAYVGRVPLPSNWDEAAELVREMNVHAFPAIPASHWADIARQWFNDDNGRPTHGYDIELAKSLSALDGEHTPLWPQFDALSGIPAMAIRGELSDCLSVKTLNEMRLRHPALSTLTVKGQGHSPLLRDRATLVAIADFLAHADHGAKGIATSRRLRTA